MFAAVAGTLGRRGNCRPWVAGSLLLAPLSAGAEGAGAIHLNVTLLPDRLLRFAWPAAGSGFGLESTSSLGTAGGWEPITAEVALMGGEQVVVLPLGENARFYRLRAWNLATIASTSPTNGETGVSVHRETIVRFSRPLGGEAWLGPENLYAVFGNRRLLTRIEVSSDRRAVSLFYLEPMPGSARVSVVFDAQGIEDELGQPLDADGDGQPGGVAVVSFDTFSTTALPGTAVVGQVFASELVPGPDTGSQAANRPLAGVTITVDGREQDLRATTDAEGRFVLEPVPAGRFFVHIDGRTVRDDAAGIRYPDQSYYPAVGKAWEAVAGRTDNLAGGTGLIYLPLIRAGTLQPVSATEDTPITFPPQVIEDNPALAGVTLTVPANALFSDDGRDLGSALDI